MSSRQPRRIAACGLANFAALCVVVAGCSQSAEVTSTAIAPEAVPPSDRVEITLVDRAEFDAVLASLRGKVVLVDCWATWCGPCVEQLPHSVELAKVHAADGLAVVTLDFDDPDAIAQVRKVLADAGANSANVTDLQCKQGSSPAAMAAFEITSGALPHYKLFDREGKLRRTFELDPASERQFTRADVDSAVEEILAR